MSKAKKKKIKQRKHETRKFQALAERIASALVNKPVKAGRDYGKMIKG